jgi:murein DD-endopeptidase MepM/ murein hydrolase activator NlpD
MATAWYQYPITHGYITSHLTNDWDSPHFADDIATPFHTPLTAIKSGKVVQADYAAWGGEVFIKPDDGSTEYYYYHLDENDVNAGQHVNAGQMVGLSGGQNTGGSHPVSTQWSTGPHTHVGYFTNWIDTVIGTRPDGPDITPLITAMKLGQAGIPSSQGISPSGGSATTTSIGDWKTQAQGGLIRVGLFAIALMVVGFGFYIMFQKQINQGAGIALKAAVL